jgi:hypothetical protein
LGVGSGFGHFASGSVWFGVRLPWVANIFQEIFPNYILDKAG